MGGEALLPVIFRSEFMHQICPIILPFVFAIYLLRFAHPKCPERLAVQLPVLLQNSKALPATASAGTGVFGRE